MSVEFFTMETITYEKRGVLALITINRPKALNALNATVFNELEEVIDRVQSDGSLRAAIITGDGGKAFAAGADITEFIELDVQGGSDLSRRGHSVFNKIESSRVPFIAAINGFALGGGFELALACHIRIASENARMGLPEVNLGLIPGYGGTQRLAQLIGKGRATEMLLTTRMVKADEAGSIGLVTTVCPQEELLNEAMKIGEGIATKGPNAISAAIQTMNACYDSEKGFETEIRNFGVAMGSEESKEGVSAFMEKRKANF